MKVKKVLKLWCGWNPSRIEKYLEAMAASGWRLATVEFAQMILGFIPDKPTKTSYCVDFNNKPSAEYLMMIVDDGWELVNKSAGWILWRKNYEGSRPEIYTDNQSLIDRNKRLLLVLIIAAMLQIPILTMIFIDQDYSDHLAVVIMIFTVYLPLLALLLFGIIRIFIANRLLKMGKR
jgi:hypothetical protein